MSLSKGVVGSLPPLQVPLSKGEAEVFGWSMLKLHEPIVKDKGMGGVVGAQLAPLVLTMTEALVLACTTSAWSGAENERKKSEASWALCKCRAEVFDENAVVALVVESDDENAVVALVVKFGN